MDLEIISQIGIQIFSSSYLSVYFRKNLSLGMTFLRKRAKFNIFKKN